MAILTRSTRFLEPLLYCLAYFRYTRTFTSLEMKIELITFYNGKPTIAQTKYPANYYFPTF